MTDKIKLDFFDIESSFLDLISSDSYWKRGLTVEQQLDRLYGRFSDSDFWGFSETVFRDWVKEECQRVVEKQYGLIFLKAYQYVNTPDGAKEERGLIEFVLMSVAVVEVELASSSPDLNLCWSFLLDALLVLEMVQTLKVVEEKRSWARLKRKGATRPIISTKRIELNELMRLIVTLKPDGGWASIKALAVGVEGEMNSFCKKNGIELSGENWYRNISTWIRLYDDLRGVYEENKRLSRSSGK